MVNGAAIRKKHPFLLRLDEFIALIDERRSFPPSAF
jgi:hypothetical protein